MDDTLYCPQYAPVVPIGTKITPRAFFQRFGQSNLLWLYGQLAGNPALAMYKDQITSAQFVDLADPVTATDLGYLLTLTGTPFTNASITTILTSPVQPSEVPT